MSDIELTRMREEIREIRQMCAEILKRIRDEHGDFKGLVCPPLKGRYEQS